MERPIGAAFEDYLLTKAAQDDVGMASPAVDADKDLQIANHFVVSWEVFGSQTVKGVKMIPLHVQLEWMPSWRVRFLSWLILGSRWTKLPKPSHV